MIAKTMDTTIWVYLDMAEPPLHINPGMPKMISMLFDKTDDKKVGHWSPIVLVPNACVSMLRARK